MNSLSKNMVKYSAVIVCILAVFAAFAGAVPTYYFGPVTNSNAANVIAGQSQLTVEVTQPAGINNQVLFTFKNVGPQGFAITDIYFYDGTLLGVSQIVNSNPGVLFASDATPRNLLGGEVYGFADASFSFNSDAPLFHNGVGPGEELGILFNLINDAVYEDTLDALDNIGFIDGNLIVGIHVQGFDNGGSESFVTNGTEPPGSIMPIPAPAALLLASFGVGVVGWMKRRKSL